MNWITKSDLKKWAGTRDCQENLPKILRMLLRAITTKVEVLSFPSGDNVHHSGLDGYLELNESVENIPEGKSIWEIGTTQTKIKSKAEYEYNNRLASPVDYDPKETTFVFVTPNVWKDRTKWIAEKKKEKKWKDVKVINSEVLEQLLELAPTVGQYLAYKFLDNPVHGTEAVESYWEKWSTSSSGELKLNHKIVLNGRESELDILINRVKNPSVTIINSRSKTESIAFIIATFFDNEELKDSFNSRSIIVDDVQTFRDFSNTKDSLILIPRFSEVDGEFNQAVNQGHVVIIPHGTGIYKKSSEEEIHLGELDRDEFVNNLIVSGLTKEKSESYAKETARNLTILRRQLKLNRDIPKWANEENVIEIIPALIVGRWDEEIEYDVKIIEQLSGENYHSYSRKLTKWLNTNNSPFIKIGSIWRIESPLDSWEKASSYLTRQDFEIIKKSFLTIWREIDPAFELDSEHRYLANLMDKKKNYSNQIRTGISQSLILISLYGDKLEYNLGINGEQWVDNIVRELLDSDDPLFWKSISSELTLISEASPNSFLSAIEKKMLESKSAIVSLFDEDPSLFLGNISYHSSLLWALENLAWNKDLLARVSLLLCSLVENDPGGNLANRPFNSLREIFMPWHHQTLANIETRKAILDLIANRYKDIAWDLFVSLLPGSSSQVAHPTHKPRWRLFESSLNPIYTHEESREMYTFLCAKLIELFDNSEGKFEQLIEMSTQVFPWDRKTILNFIQETSNEVDHKESLGWHKIRKILSHQRSFPDSNRAMPESELAIFEELYKKLEPVNILDKTKWMFEEGWPSFKDGFKKELSSDEKEIIIEERRQKILTEIYQKEGINTVKELVSLVKQQWIFGKSLALVIDNYEEIIELLVENDEPDFAFVNGFFIGFFKRNDFDHSKLYKLYNDLEGIGVSNELLIRVFISVRQNLDVWSFIESKGEDINSLYWQSIQSWFIIDDPELASKTVSNYLHYESYENALDAAYRARKMISSSIIINVLIKYGQNSSGMTKTRSEYEIMELIEELDKRDDYEQKQIVNIEFYFLNILAGSYNSRGPKLLHLELEKNPNFFAQMLSYAYLPSDERLLEKVKEEYKSDSRRNAASNSATLLDSWKSIPGIKSAEEIDEKYLSEWINTARELAKKESREKGFDIVVGKLFSNYPKVDDHVPPDIICQIIETINTSTIKGCFSSAMHNLNSMSSRSPYAGGDIERAKANYYYKISEALNYKFPIVSEIFRSIGKWFEEDSSREDNKGRMIRLDY